MIHKIVMGSKNINETKLLIVDHSILKNYFFKHNNCIARAKR